MKIFIKNYLLQKGLNEKLININFESFENENPDWEEKSALIFVRKKNVKTDDIENKDKNLAKMARAGFSYNLIKKIGL